MFCKGQHLDLHLFTYIEICCYKAEGQREVGCIFSLRSFEVNLSFGNLLSSEKNSLVEAATWFPWERLNKSSYCYICGVDFLSLGPKLHLGKPDTRENHGLYDILYTLHALTFLLEKKSVTNPRRAS